MGLLFIIVLFQFCSFYGSSDGRTLLLSNVLFRHGDRSPIWYYPNDPQNGPETWPQGREGELTAEGMKQEFILGTQLKLRYQNLGLTFNPNNLANKIHVRSTDVNRTLMSANSLLAGLINGTNAGNHMTIADVNGWPANWQPVPVHTVPTHHDYLLLSDRGCSLQDRIYQDKVLNSPDWMNKQKENLAFFQTLAKNAGIVSMDLDSIFSVWDTYLIENLPWNRANHAWPKWMNQALFDKIQDLTYFSDVRIFHDPMLARLNGGWLLKEIVQNMKKKILCLHNTTISCKAINNLQLNLYSAHDSTTMMFIETLANQGKGSDTGAAKLTFGGLPRFGASAIIDLFWRTMAKLSQLKLITKITTITPNLFLFL